MLNMFNVKKNFIIALAMIFLCLIGSTLNQTCRLPGMRRTNLVNSNMNAYGTGRLLPLTITNGEGEGALWFNRKILVHPRLEIGLRVEISNSGCWDPRSRWAIDGFVITLSKSPNYLNGGGGSMGYFNIYDALVTEIDLYYNGEAGDISGNSISIHKCFRTNCNYFEGANTVQRNLPMNYDVCRTMIYDIVIIYNNGNFRVQLGDTYLVDINENLSTRFDNWAYLGFSGFVRGNPRQLAIAGSYICEDDYINTDFTPLWLVSGQFIAQQTMTVLAGSTQNISIMFKNVSGLTVPHTLGLGLWTWNISVGTSCGNVKAFSALDNMTLTTTLSECTRAGSQRVVFNTDKGAAPAILFRVIARAYERLNFAGYNDNYNTERTSTVLDMNMFFNFNWGSLEGEFSADEFAITKGLNFNIYTTDLFDNIFTLGTDAAVVAPQLGITANNSVSAINPTTTVVLNGRYKIFIPVTVAGEYFVSSKMLDVNRTGKRYRFYVHPGVPTSIKSVCNLVNYQSTPTVGAGVSISIRCLLYDQFNNQVAVENSIEQYGLKYGCKRDRLSYDNKSSSIEIQAVIASDSFKCIDTTDLNGKFTFTPYFINSQGIMTNIPVQLNTFYVQPAPTDIATTQLYDFASNKFLGLVNKSITMGYVASASQLTIIEFFDKDGTPYSSIGYPTNFDKNSIAGLLSDTHNLNRKVAVKFDYTSLLNKRYLGIFIDDKTFITKSSHLYKLDITLNGVTITVNFTFPLGPTNGRLVCTHPVSLPTTQFLPTSTTGSLQTFVNSDVIVGQIVLQTSDGFLYNYRYDLKAFQVTVTPQDSATNIYITEHSTVEGYFNIRIFSTKANTYKISLSISNTPVITNYSVQVTPQALATNLEASNLNTYVSNIGTEFDKYLSNAYTNDVNPIIYFNSMDDFKNLLSYVPNLVNSYLGVQVNLLINGVPVDVKYDALTISFNYDTTKNAYYLIDNIKRAGAYDLTITSGAKKTLIFRYTKKPGKVTAVTSSSSLATAKNLKISNTASVLINLKDKSGISIASDEELGKTSVQSMKVIATAQDSSILNLKFVEISQMSMRFTTDPIMKPSTFTISITYTDPTTKEVIDVACPDCVFYVTYDQFDIKNCKLSAVLSKTLEMSQNSILQVNNQVDKPLFNFNFYDTNNSQLQFVDQSSKLKATFTGENLDIAINLEWIGTNQIMWTFPAERNLKDIKGANYILNILYNDVISQKYTLQFLGDGNDSDAGNGDANYDLTFFSTTDIRPTAGLNFNFNIQFRTEQNLRVNSYGDLTKFSFSNSKSLNADLFKAAVQFGAKKGDYIITVNSIVSSTTVDPIILTVTFNGIKLKQTVNIIVRSGELAKLVINPTNILDSTKLTLKSGKTIENKIIQFTAFDKYNNNFDDLFDTTIFSMDRIATLFNFQHSNNNQITSSVTTNITTKTFLLSAVVRNIGTVTLSSSLMTDAWKFEVLPGPLSSLYTFGLVVPNTNLIAGEEAVFKIFPKDQYQNAIKSSLLIDVDYDLVGLNVILPRGITALKDKIVKSRNTQDDSVEFKVTLLEAGNNNFQAKVGTTLVTCSSCQIKVNLSPLVFLKSKLLLNTEQLSTSVTFNLNKGSIPTLSLSLIDKFDNPYTQIPADFKIIPTFSGNDSTINLCTAILNAQLTITVCPDTLNVKNWMYLVSMNGYTINLQRDTENLTYKINLVGGTSDADASNGPIDVNKTFFSTTKLSAIAGQFATFMIELRTKEGKRKNYWYDTPLDNIKLSFTQVFSNTYTYDVIIGEKPGQYNIKVSSSKTFSLTANNLISLTIENVKCTANTLLMTILPDVPVSAAFVKVTGEEIVRGGLPQGNTDNDYILNAKLFDKFKNVADVEAKDFNYSVQAPASKLIERITSVIVKNSDKSFTMTINTIYSGIYTINSVLLGVAYTFEVIPGIPSAINSLAIAPIKAKAGDNVLLFIVPFDAKNNYIDPRTAGLKNNFNLAYKYKDGLTDNYVSYVPLNQVTILPVTADIGCKDCFGYAYSLQLKFRNQNFFRSTLGASQEIKCVNCVTNVDPSELVFAQSDFRRYDSVAGKFVSLEENANEDNAKTDIIYRVYPRDNFLNKIDTISDVTKYTLVLTDKDSNTYTLKNQSDPSTPQEYVEFVKNDDKTINDDLSYNTLTGGAYTATFYNGAIKLDKKIVLIGRDGDSVASNQDIEEQNTVINESNLNFKAGQTGYIIVELRTINNLRKNNWNQVVNIKYQILDNDGKVLTEVDGEDKSFTSSVRPAGVLGVFYATIATTLSTTTLKDRRLVLQIVVNNKIVTKLSPQVIVAPSAMTRANILQEYLLTGSTSVLREGDADTTRSFKVAAFDVYNNPTICEPLALKLSALGPDGNSAVITAGREVTTGLATYVIENKIAGEYSIASDSGLLTKYTFKNKNGKLLPENSFIVNNDKAIIAGNMATINITPKDKYNNDIPINDVKLDFMVQIQTPSGKNLAVELVSTTGRDLVYYKLLTEKGINTWRITIKTLLAQCEDCLTTVNPNVPKPQNSVLSTENAGGVLTYYINNSELTRNIKSPLRVYITLFDTYGNLIDTPPSDMSVTPPILSGKNMKPMVFEVIINSEYNKFKLRVPSTSEQAFNHLVSGDYNLSFSVDRKSVASANFNFKVKLISDSNDSGYGNGNYVVEQTEMSNTSLTLFADTTFTLNMKLKTADRLYFNDDIDLVNDVKYTITPSDSSFKFNINKKGVNYADYNIDVYSSISQPDTQINLAIQIRDPTDPNVFKTIPTIVTINIKPRIPPFGEKTVIVSKPTDSIKSSQSLTISFKLYDKFNNLYLRNSEIIDNNNIIVTNNNIQVTNAAIQLKSDGSTYEVSFLPQYPPRNCEVMIYYKDSKQQVNILTQPILTKVISDPHYPNTLVASSNMYEMNAGQKIDIQVTFYDLKNICIDNIDNIPVFATVNGPLEFDDSKRINYQYKFNLITGESKEINACVKSFVAVVPDNQIYNIVGTYKVIVKVGENGYEAKVFNQKIVPDVLDTTKFVSRYTMGGEFNPGNIIAGTLIKFNIQGNDRFNNPIRTTLNPDVSLRLVSKSGVVAISDKDNAEKFDYEIQLLENTNGILTGSLKIFTAEMYLIQYLYKNNALNQIDISRGPFDVTINTGSCSAQNPGIVLDDLLKATTGTPAVFQINCKDIYNNIISKGGEPFKIFLGVHVEETKTSTEVKTQVVDNNNGNYQVNFLPPLSGSYNLVVDLRGEIYYNYKFSIKDNVCPKETPNRCPNKLDKCVVDQIDCIDNRNNCPVATPFSCQVNSVESCVKSQNECDCPSGQMKCDYPNLCIPQGMDYMCSFSLPLSCKRLFPDAKTLCIDGICRSSINEAPSPRVCPIGFVICPDLTCRSDYNKCSAYDDCPKSDMIRCPDQSCVMDQKDCPSSITCPKVGMVVCPDGTCTNSEVYCKPLPICNAPNVVLCADNSCVSDIKDCPKQVSCGHGKSLCQDIICRTTCLN